MNNEKRIVIGRMGENLVKAVRFDLSCISKELPEAEVKLLHKRATDNTPYLVQSRVEGHELIWEVTETDTAVVGWGSAELIATKGEQVLLSEIYTVIVNESLLPVGEVPDPLQHWYDDIINASIQVGNDKNSVAEMKAAFELELVPFDTRLFAVESGLGIVSESLTQETTERTNEITRVEEIIEDEITARENADIELSNAITSEETARKNADEALGERIDAEETARAQDKAQLEQLISQEALSRENADAEIQKVIPSQASEDNQLADKDFVNSSIATNTSYFKGTFNSVEELSQITDLTNNDYAFVKSADASGNTVYNRYKYNADENRWIFEYALNNSSFTASQWAAINSGITSEKVAQIGENITAIGNLERNKVEKEVGKGLSTNDYTNEEKNKVATIDDKMERKVFYLSQASNVWTLKDEGGNVVGFTSFYNTIRNESNYVVVLIGNSKLRPQYVSTNEIHCDGEDRDANSTNFLRMVMTPSVLYYGSFPLAEKTYVYSKNEIDTMLESKADASEVTQLSQDIDKLKALGLSVVNGGICITFNE